MSKPSVQELSELWRERATGMLEFSDEGLVTSYSAGCIRYCANELESALSRQWVAVSERSPETPGCYVVMLDGSEDPDVDYWRERGTWAGDGVVYWLDLRIPAPPGEKASHDNEG